MDASTRSFIFQQKILPELKRDIDRAMERLTGFGHLPLVPIPVAAKPSAKGPDNPLIELRQQVLALKPLRARLQSPRVSTFALEPADKAAIDALDRRVADVLHLSNLADAARKGHANGYASARKNLEALLGELNTAVQASGTPPATILFRAAMAGRYRALAELCRVCEELLTPNALAGGPLAERLDGVAASLDGAADAFERSGYSPVEAMPMVLAVKEEAASTRLLARWLRSYDTLCTSGATSFGVFAEAAAGLTAGAPDAEQSAELLEGCTAVIAAARGIVLLPADADFSWVAGFAEQGRQKKSLGLFGAEEQVAGVDEFLFPVWLIELTYSQAAGKIFASGVEQRRLVLVNAIDTTGDRVVFREGTGFAAPAPLQNRRVLLPRVSRPYAVASALRAAVARGDMLNPRGRSLGLGLVPGAVVRYAGKTNREAASCLGGALLLPIDLRAQLEHSARLLKTLA